MIKQVAYSDTKKNWILDEELFFKLYKRFLGNCNICMDSILLGTNYKIIQTGYTGKINTSVITNGKKKYTIIDADIKYLLENPYLLHLSPFAEFSGPDGFNLL